MLVLLDPGPPSYVVPTKSAFEKMAHYGRRVHHHLKEGRLLAWLSDFLVHRRAWWLKMSAEREGASQNLRVKYVNKCHDNAQKSYSPQMYTGKITVFRSDELQAREKEGKSAWAIKRWSELTTGEFESHLIPGGHREILFGPQLKLLAEQVAVCLEEARAKIFANRIS